MGTQIPGFELLTQKIADDSENAPPAPGILPRRIREAVRKIADVGLSPDVCGKSEDNHGIRANSDPGEGSGANSRKRRDLQRSPANGIPQGAAQESGHGKTECLAQIR